MMHDLSNKYYIKRLLEDEWEDVTEAFAGVKILSIDGFNEKGDAVNGQRRTSTTTTLL